MRFPLFLVAAVLVAAVCGCSCMSTVERANLIPADSRDEYVNMNPDGQHNDCIRNGEIVRGMCAREVVASWGLPNVYVVSKTNPSEEWIFYVRDRDSLSMLIYTLGFNDDTLRTWEVEQKRLVGQGVVSSDAKGQKDIPGATPSGPTKR